jgi:hypothetical protein
MGPEDIYNNNKFSETIKKKKEAIKMANMFGGGNTLGMPYQMQMMGGDDPNENLDELPHGRCSEQCQSLFCPCYVFGRIVNRMHGGRGSVDMVACGSWAAFLLCCWGGTATAAQLLAAQLGSGVAQYSSYALYTLFYLEYMYPYLQGMYMYKSLKGLYNVRRGQPLLAGDESVEISVPCHQWCTFACCPCSYLGSVERYVNAMNNPLDNNNSSTVLQLRRQNLCPFECQNDYKIVVRPLNGGQAARSNNIQQELTPNADYLMQQQLQQQQQYYGGGGGGGLYM